MISNSVTSVLKESFGVTDDKIQIDPTQNTYNFNGYDESPFSVILDLAPQSISTLGDPGYFFYETQNGMNFRSIDSLIKDGEEKVKDKTIPKKITQSSKSYLAKIDNNTKKHFLSGVAIFGIVYDNNVNSSSIHNIYKDVTGLICNKTYTIKALAYNANGDSITTNERKFNIHTTFGLACN